MGKQSVCKIAAALPRDRAAQTTGRKTTRRQTVDSTVRDMRGPSAKTLDEFCRLGPSSRQQKSACLNGAVALGPLFCLS